MPSLAKKDFRPGYEYLIYKTMMQYRQKRPARIATGCSGLETPILACIENCIDYQHLFSSEVRHEAREFAEKAGVRAEHAYGNICFVHKQEGHCYIHNKVCPYAELDREDVFIVGPPCQGCSSLNNSCLDADVEELQMRDDHVILEAIAFHMQSRRPRIVILENVMGLMKKRGRTGKTAYQMLLDLIAEKAPAYKVHVFTGDAAYWVPMPRSRPYLVFVSEDTGGADALDKIKATMEVL